MILTKKTRLEITLSTRRPTFYVVRRFNGHVLAIAATREEGEREKARINAQGRGYTFHIDVIEVRSSEAAVEAGVALS